jgi:hypothetical protein
MHYMPPFPVGSTFRLTINPSDSEPLVFTDLPFTLSPYFPRVVPNHSHPLFTTYTSIQGSLLYVLFTIP